MGLIIFFNALFSAARLKRENGIICGMASFREIFYKAKWRRFHPTAFAKFDALVANERRSLDENEPRIRAVLTAFASRLGGEVPVKFKRVSSIPHDRGKLRFVVREH